MRRLRRRRLIVILGALALVAVWAAWWLFLPRLSAEEQKLVGLWRYAVGGDDRQWHVEFAPDRRARWGILGDDAWEVGHWSVRDGAIVIDHEVNPIRRAIRPAALRI